MASFDPMRAARQQLQTSMLLGVDFVPRRNRVSAHPVLLDPPESSAGGRSNSGDASDRGALLEGLRRRHELECPHCTCCTGFTQMVFGEGDPFAAIMFVGEAPGEEEDKTGRPFVGRAGQKLDEIIRAMGLAREQVYIANILKVRPPNNRTPQPDEAARCGPFLHEQISIIQPRVLVALGGPAAKYLLDTNEGITRLRGSWFLYRNGGIEIPLMPTFHPAYVLRNYTRETRQKVWADMQEVMKRAGLTA